MGGRANDRATAARAAATTRMRQAAERVRADDVGDRPGAREAVGRLLEHLAGQQLDVHTFDRAAALADRILATPPARLLENGQSVSPGYGDNGQPSRQRW